MKIDVIVENSRPRSFCIDVHAKGKYWVKPDAVPLNFLFISIVNVVVFHFSLLTAISVLQENTKSVMTTVSLTFEISFWLSFTFDLQTNLVLVSSMPPKFEYFRFVGIMLLNFLYGSLTLYLQTALVSTLPPKFESFMLVSIMLSVATF